MVMQDLRKVFDKRSRSGIWQTLNVYLESLLLWNFI